MKGLFKLDLDLLICFLYLLRHESEDDRSYCRNVAKELESYVVELESEAIDLVIRGILGINIQRGRFHDLNAHFLVLETSMGRR